MKKSYFIYYVLIVLILSFKSIKVLGQTDYFRSANSGLWHDPNTWETSPDGVSNWVPSTYTPTAEANTITIRSGHTVTVANNTTVDQVVITNGSVLEIATGAATVLTVNDGRGSDIVVQNGGVFKHNIAGASSLPSFSGSATLEVQEGGVLEAANNNGTSSHYANIASPIASNIIWQDGAIFNWNNTSTPAEGVTYFPATAAIPIFRISQPITIGGTNSTIINGLLEANADVSFQGNSTKTFRNGISGTGKVSVTALNGGQFIINGSTAKLGGTGILELNNNGLLINPGTIVTMISNKIINNYNNGTSNSTGTVTTAGTIISGDFIISGNSKIAIDGTVKTTNVNGLSGGTNTTFATGFTLQPFGTVSSIEYNREGNQAVTPVAYNNLTISGTGSKIAGTGNDVSVGGVLNIMAGSTFSLNGTNNLKLNGGGTLNINANAVFDNGGESQVSGGGTPTVNIYGTFITQDAQGFSGTNTSVPGATINIFEGSTIEYGKAGDQIVTRRNDYRNITFSGSGIKAIPTCRPIGTVTIKDDAIADASNKTFGDTTATNLVMLGGRFIVGGTGTKPDIAGTYNLTGGVIEFTTSGATKETIRSPLTYLNIEVSGTNVFNSSGITTLADGGSFRVKTGGIFENSGLRIDGPTGIQTLILEAGSTFKTGVKGGFAGNDSAALRNIENLIIDPKSTIVYNRKGDQTLTPLVGHPNLLLKVSGNKTVASGNLIISQSADSVVVDTAVVFRVSSGAKVDFQNRPVFIKSNPGATGMIGEITDGPSALLNATNVTVERFIPARRAYRFLSPSVTTISSIKANWMEGAVNPNTTTRINPNPGYGTNITGRGGAANGFDPTITNNPSLFIFNTLSQKWDSVPNSNGTLSAGDAYSLMVRGDRSINMTTNTPTPTNTILRATGTLFTGTFSPAVNSTDGYYSFIGNPYASAVNWNTLIRKDITTTYYAWDPNLNERGAYATYNGTENVTAPKESKIDQNIQPGQAFFVRTTKTTSPNPNPVLIFNESNKTGINKAVFRPVSLMPRLSIQLLLNTEGGSQNTADGTIAFFDDSFTPAISNEDSYKFTNIDENLAINREGTALSIEGRPIRGNDTISLQMWQFKHQSYYLKLEGINFPAESTAFLEDAYLHSKTLIKLSSISLIPFTIDSSAADSYAKNRFAVVFKSGTALPLTRTDIKGYEKDNGIEVEWTTLSDVNIDRYEIEASVNGLNFKFAASIRAKANNTATQKYNWFDASAHGGNNFYRLKIIEKSGAVKYSGIINVEISTEKKLITISPNPVNGNQVTLNLLNVEKGKYTVGVYNSIGQKVYDGKIVHTGFPAKYDIVLGRKMPKGIYRMTISKKDKSFTETLIYK